MPAISTCPRSTTGLPAVYRPRRPAASVLHRTVREHLETFLAAAQAGDDDLRPIRPAAERALREYPRCGIPAYGFARVRCAACKHEYLVAFSCKDENRPLQCPRCGHAMVILAFILEREVIERILRYIGEATIPPRILPARSPPQLEMDFAQTAGPVTWDEVNQTTAFPDEL